MERNIKYIVSFIDNKTNKHLCYLTEGYYTKVKKGCMLFESRELAYAHADYSLNMRLMKYSRGYYNKSYTLRNREYNELFNGVPKCDVFFKIHEYNIIKEERLDKMKEIFEQCL